MARAVPHFRQPESKRVHKDLGPGPNRTRLLRDLPRFGPWVFGYIRPMAGKRSSATGWLSEADVARILRTRPDTVARWAALGLLSGVPTRAGWAISDDQFWHDRSPEHV